MKSLEKEQAATASWGTYLIWGVKGLAAVTGAALVYGFVRSVMQGELFSGEPVSSTGNEDTATALSVYKEAGSNATYSTELFSSSPTLVARCGDEWRVSNLTVAYQSPSVAALDNENFVMSWNSYHHNDSMSAIYSQVFKANSTTLTEQWQIDQATQGILHTPWVVRLDANRFMTTWQKRYKQAGSRKDDIYGQLFAANGTTLADKWQINRSHNDDISAMALLGKSERLAVCWQSYWGDGARYNVYAQVFTMDGNALIDAWQVNQITEDSYGSPTLAVLENDRLLVSWSGMNRSSSYYGIYARLFTTNGSALTNEWQVNQGVELYWQGRPTVAVLDDNRFIISWVGGSRYDDIYARLFTTDGRALGNEWLVNQVKENEEHQGALITALDSERVAITWGIERQAKGIGIYAQVFTANGAKLSDVWQVNQVTQYLQRNPTAITLTNERLLFSWENIEREESLFSVYTRVCGLFSAPPLLHSNEDTTKANTSLIFLITGGTITFTLAALVYFIYRRTHYTLRVAPAIDCPNVEPPRYNLLRDGEDAQAIRGGSTPPSAPVEETQELPYRTPPSASSASADRQSRQLVGHPNKLFSSLAPAVSKPAHSFKQSKQISTAQRRFIRDALTTAVEQIADELQDEEMISNLIHVAVQGNEVDFRAALGKHPGIQSPAEDIRGVAQFTRYQQELSNLGDGLPPKEMWQQAVLSTLETYLEEYMSSLKDSAVPAL